MLYSLLRRKKQALLHLYELLTYLMYILKDVMTLVDALIEESLLLNDELERSKIQEDYPF